MKPSFYKVVTFFAVVVAVLFFSIGCAEVGEKRRVVRFVGERGKFSYWVEDRFKVGDTVRITVGSIIIIQ